MCVCVCVVRLVSVAQWCLCLASVCVSVCVCVVRLVSPVCKLLAFLFVNVGINNLVHC